MVLVNVDGFDADDNEYFHADFNHGVGGGRRRPRPGGVEKPRKLSFSSDSRSSKLFFATRAAS